MKKHILIITVCTVLVVAGAGYFFAQSGDANYKFIPVTRGQVTETVSVTGNTSPVQSVSLGFGRAGTIAHVYAKIGDNVEKGEILAELNTDDLYAQIKQAKASVDTQQAKLDGLVVGSRPEDLAVSVAASEKAKQDLANMYQSIIDTSIDSYSKANDAIRVQLGPQFINTETNNPKLSYYGSNTQSEIDANTQRYNANIILNAWQNEINQNSSSNTSLDSLLQKGIYTLSSIRLLLTNVSKSLDGATSINDATIAAYKAAATVGLNEVNTASKNLNTLTQSISSQKLVVTQAQAQLSLKQAGTSDQDIKAQTAQLESAEANLESIQAKLTDSQITAPIPGVITQFDAKIGQAASPGVILLSIISGKSFEIDTLVSEIDVGKISVGNKVRMTFDAFPQEDFVGTVFFIDPAQTTSEGVVGYKIKISFDNIDPRTKSGLTANLNIETRKKDNVLTLPQYAILQNDKGSFVQILEKNKVIDIPVKLGLQDENGNVEITSGVSEGMQVLNIGLKQK